MWDELKEKVTGILEDGYYPDRKSAEEATDEILASVLMSAMKQPKREKIIYHILAPQADLLEDTDTLRYEVILHKIAEDIEKAEADGYKPTEIVFCLKANLGHIYGLPARLKLIG